MSPERSGPDPDERHPARGADRPEASSERDDMDARHIREVARRAVWRITVLEYVLLGAAAVLAVLAGGLAAWALARWGGLPLVPSWIVVAVLVFAIPALAVWYRERREDRRLEVLRERTPDEDRRTGEPPHGAEDASEETP